MTVFDSAQIRDNGTGTGTAGIRVAIKSRSETLFAVSDHAGRFEFRDIRPGQWTLSADTTCLPANQYLDIDPSVLEVHPGGQARPHIRVMTRKRVIRMMQQQDVFIEELPEGLGNRS